MKRDSIVKDMLLMAHQNSRWLLFWLASLAVAGVGCTKAHMSHNLSAPIDLAPKDAVTVVLDQFSGEFSTWKEDKFVGCITKAIRKAHPTVRIVPPDEFRQAAFPDLPPEEVQAGDRSWKQLAGDPAVRQRVAPLDVHYLITLSGETIQNLKFGLHGDFNAAALGFIGEPGDRTSSLEATVIDLKQGSEAGRLHAWAYNIARTGWIILPFPFYVPSRTETRVCRELGEGVAAMLAVEKPPGEVKAEPLEEEIREEWKRTKDEDQQGQFIGHGYAPTPFE